MPSEVKICTADETKVGNDCVLTTCDAGKRVVGGKCEPNICSCDNGIAVTGAECTTHESNTCGSCNTAFKLDAGTRSCIGTVFLDRRDNELGSVRLCNRLSCEYHGDSARVCNGACLEYAHSHFV